MKISSVALWTIDMAWRYVVTFPVTQQHQDQAFRGKDGPMSQRRLNVLPFKKPHDFAPRLLSTKLGSSKFVMARATLRSSPLFVEKAKLLLRIAPDLVPIVERLIDEVLEDLK